MTSQSLTGNEVSTQPASLSWRSWAAALLSSPAGNVAATQGLALRLGLAAVMLPHGLQKSVGLFGGYGWSGTMGFFTETMGMPAPVAATVILTELLGPFLLLAGVAVRPVAAAFVGLMLGAIVMVHGQFGFFMNWFGQQEGQGFEYHLLVIALAAALVIGGAGRWSVDHLAAKKLRG